MIGAESMRSRQARHELRRMPTCQEETKSALEARMLVSRPSQQLHQPMSSTFNIFRASQTRMSQSEMTLSKCTEN